MSYNKHTWETKEVITAEKMNHMEDGIAINATGPFFIDLNELDYAVDENGDETSYLEYELNDLEQYFNTGFLIIPIGRSSHAFVLEWGYDIIPETEISIVVFYTFNEVYRFVNTGTIIPIADDSEEEPPEEEPPEEEPQ